MNEAEALAEFKKLEGQGIFALALVLFNGMPGPRRIGVRVVVALMPTADVTPLQWNIELVNKRGASVVLSDWAVLYNEATKQRTIEFMASMQLPENANLSESGIYASSFADLCWFQGNEAVPADHNSDVNTLRDSTPYNDLGWFLPCRFADRLIDALGKANDTLLSGILEDAMLYGPYFKN